MFIFYRINELAVVEAMKQGTLLDRHLYRMCNIPMPLCNSMEFAKQIINFFLRQDSDINETLINHNSILIMNW